MRRALLAADELEAAGVPEHVRVHGEGEPGLGRDPRELLAKGRRGDRGLALGGEHVRARRYLLALEPAQGAQLGAADVVHAGASTLEPAHVEGAALEVEL